MYIYKIILYKIICNIFVYIMDPKMYQLRVLRKEVLNPLRQILPRNTFKDPVRTAQ
jgi:hypothetical protein